MLVTVASARVYFGGRRQSFEASAKIVGRAKSPSLRRPDSGRNPPITSRASERPSPSSM